MEELFEYMIPLQGLFRKKRSPRMIESYKKLSNFSEIADDFKTAVPYLDDAVRLGKTCIFRKEQITVLYLRDVVKACFRVHGCDASDEYGAVSLLCCDGSEELLFRTSETDGQKVTAEIFPALNSLGIETSVIVTR